MAQNNTDFKDFSSISVTLPFPEKEQENNTFLFSSSLSSINENGEMHPFDTSETNNTAVFFQNYKYWDQETRFMSVNNFENKYFRKIVSMGIDAVPYILEKIQEEPSQLVHALDLIFPGVIEYDGFVTLEDACKKWISILK